MGAKAKVKQKKFVSGIQPAAVHNILKVDPVVSCDYMALLRDVPGKKLFRLKANQVQENLPATKRYVVGQQQTQLFGIAFRLSQETLNQVLSRREIGRHDLVLTVHAMPVITFGYRPMSENVVSLGVPFHHQGTGAVGDYIEENLAR